MITGQADAKAVNLSHYCSLPPRCLPLQLLEREFFLGGGRRRIGCCKAQMEELCKSGRPSGDRTGVTAGDDSAKKGPLGVVGGILVGVQEILTRNILKRRVKTKRRLEKAPAKKWRKREGRSRRRSLLQLKLFFARELFFSSLLL